VNKNMKKKFSVLINLLLISFIFSQTDTTLVETNDKLINIHAENANLSSILSIVADDSNYNIVTGPSVSENQKLTIHLDDTPIIEAIDLIIRAAGLSYEIIGNAILVASSSRLQEEVGISPYVIELEYANAAEIQALLLNISENITLDKSGNKLLVNASPKKIAEIKNIIQQVDVPALQIMLEAKLIEISVSDEDKLGIDWSKLNQITTIVAENAAPLGVEGGGITGSLLPGMNYVKDELGNIVETFEPKTTGQIPDQMYFQRISPDNQIGFSRQMTAFDITLDMLLKSNEANLLANSKIVTLNGHKASISMVDVIPYVLSSGGVGGQVQVAREEVGIKLDILPTVNADGVITAEIIPEVSSIYDFIGPDNNIPWVKKRISNTTIRVQNNESIIIAGLLGADKRYETNKVPILWRIPFIGKKFFMSTSEVERKTDLIIQITPTIVEDGYSNILKTSNHQKVENSLDPSQTEEME
tara:strand:+ start:4273 stop:5694 length:1422 start_codon:yes stop_codon:yes gene_type:complete